MKGIILKCKFAHANDYELIDVLRDITSYNCSAVMDRTWAVSELDFNGYDASRGGLKRYDLVFPEIRTGEPSVARWSDENRAAILVSGERLMERVSLMHSIEAGLFARIVDAERPVVISNDLHLFRSPLTFQATNVDLEIRRDEMEPYEIVTADEKLVLFLQDRYAQTEAVTLSNAPSVLVGR